MGVHFTIQAPLFCKATVSPCVVSGWEEEVEGVQLVDLAFNQVTNQKKFHLPWRPYVCVRMTFQALCLTPGFAACLRGKEEPITLCFELLWGSPG